MKYCHACAAEMPDDASFCPECGQGQATILRGGEAAPPQQTLGGLQTILPGGTVLPDPNGEDALQPGAVFASRYEIEGLVGQGGMGVVHRARDTLTGKTVALKLVSPRLFGSEQAVQRLIAEGATAQDIRHENIVSVYDVGRADERIYVSMEYVEGPSLRSWISERMSSGEDVPMRVASRIIAEILDGLKAAHAKGVIHRDLKPENIILLRDPVETAAPLKILDFGIARSANTSAMGSGSSGAMGTFDYMAPEQRTNPDSAGPAADLYSVSKIYYELLVGVLPTGHWQPPSGGRTDVPVGIDALIEQGLSNRPQTRPQSAADYRRILVDAVNMRWTGGPVASPRPQPQSRSPVHPTAPSAFSAAAAIGGSLPKWVIWAGGGALALLLLIMIAAAMGGGDEAIYDPPEPSLNPQGQAQGLGLADLSGTWDDGAMRFSIRVDQSGQFSGSGTAPNGEPVLLSGYVPSRGTGEYIVTGQWSGASTVGTTSWPGDCHVNFSFVDGFSGRRTTGQWHIDHASGQTNCPRRFR